MVKHKYRLKYSCDKGGHEYIVDNCPYCRIAELEKSCSEKDEMWDAMRKWKCDLEVENKALQEAILAWYASSTEQAQATETALGDVAEKLLEKTNGS